MGQIKKTNFLEQHFALCKEAQKNIVEVMTKELVVRPLMIDAYNVYIHAQKESGGDAIETLAISIYLNDTKDGIFVIGDNEETYDLFSQCLDSDSIYINYAMEQALIDLLYLNFYIVNVPGKYGYSFMVQSLGELYDEDVIYEAEKNNLFHDANDATYAMVESIVTENDIKHFKEWNCCYVIY